MKIRKFLRLMRAYCISYFVPSAPFVRMIPTDRCNLKCSYCWQRKDNSYVMTLEEFHAYLQKAKQLHVGMMTFLGGEPMTWPHLYDALEACSKTHLLTEMTTNGTLLNRETIHRLAASGLDYLNISVDGLQPSSVTVKNSIVCNDRLDLLKAARQKYHMHFRINAVIYNDNFDEIKKIIDFARREDLLLSLGYVVPALKPEQRAVEPIYFTDNDTERLHEIVDYIREKIQDGCCIIDPMAYFEGIFDYLKHKRFWHCNYPTRYGWINVTPEGDVRSCTKKMDRLDYPFLELNRQKLREVRAILGENVECCNVQCYSNCAFDSHYFARHKREFIMKSAQRALQRRRHIKTTVPTRV